MGAGSGTRARSGGAGGAGAGAAASRRGRAHLVVTGVAPLVGVLTAPLDALGATSSGDASGFRDDGFGDRFFDDDGVPSAARAALDSRRSAASSLLTRFVAFFRIVDGGASLGAAGEVGVRASECDCSGGSGDVPGTTTYDSRGAAGVAGGAPAASSSASW